LFYNQMIENLNSCLEGKPKRILEWIFPHFGHLVQKGKAFIFG
jgi:hypothetical protein